MEGLLGNLGGLMGLYLGGSLITVVELLVFLFSLAKHGFRRIFGVNRIHDINS